RRVIASELQKKFRESYDKQPEDQSEEEAEDWRMLTQSPLSGHVYCNYSGNSKHLKNEDKNNKVKFRATPKEGFKQLNVSIRGLYEGRNIPIGYVDDYFSYDANRLRKSNLIASAGPQTEEELKEFFRDVFF